MKLPFEEWCIQKRFSRNVTALLNESFTCYRNTAYRASLLFSYLGFLTILKELIIRSAKPVSIPQGRWDNIIAKLQGDDTWEKAVYEELINSSAAIFNINDDLRQQIKYWKDRRNDCAHFKTNDIESHHTESFWSFVKSNLVKITIEGGKESLLTKFERHFDQTFTPPNADVTNLVREIDESVDTNDLSSFWVELLRRIDQYAFTFQGRSHATDVVNKVLECCSDKTKESLVDFIKTKEYDLTIITLYPDKINLLDYSPSEVRAIWRTRIFNREASAYAIYATLLRNSLIPDAEVKEANNHLIDILKHQSPQEEGTHLALAGNGFGDVLYEKAIQDDRLNNWYFWVNPRADLLAYLVRKYPLRDLTVEVICEMYTRSRYSHWLGERIEELFKNDSVKKSEFHAIANRNGHTIPEQLL